MSRRPRSELQFGSDSFLDVVANIVGILIILIVIAGLKVSQSPIFLVRPELVAGPDVDASPLIEMADEQDAVAIEPHFVPEDELPNPAPSHVVRQETSAPAVVDPPRELTELAANLAQEITTLEQGSRTLSEQTAALRQTEAELSEQFSQVEGQAKSKARERSSLARELELQQTSREQLLATAESLLQQIDEEIRKQPPLEKLEHRVTPLSKVVQGHEQHFRLSANRVSEVPVTLLSARLKDQIERRKDWLLKQRSHQGTVGPVGGYVMNYLVQRDSLGVMDEVRYGSGVVRISVANWRIEPDASLVTESADEALRQGSRFYDSLMAADEGTSLTFWVYPDSYSLYRKLQRFAHEQGFLVAGRPLPTGIPISGSPNGSKSAGQ